MENQQAPVIGVKDWVITYLISAIPIVGFVMLFVWAFSSSENPNKSNWAKAALIWTAIVMVFTFFIVLLLWGTIAAIIMGAAGSGNDI